MGRDREPYQPGNFAAEKHGALSPRRVQPLADGLAAEIVTAAPWTGPGAFAGAVADLAWHLAVKTLLRDWIDEHGLLSDEAQAATNLLDRTHGRIDRLRAELALTPASWSRLVTSLGSANAESAARGLESLRAVGRELVRTAALPEGKASDE
jgi:hypothetical protein